MEPRLGHGRVVVVAETRDLGSSQVPTTTLLGERKMRWMQTKF